MSKALELAAELAARCVRQPCALTAAAAEELRRLALVEAAFDKWGAKTEWVQETAQPSELGWHRADILRRRIDALSAQLTKEQASRKAAQIENETRKAENLRLNTARQERDGLRLVVAELRRDAERIDWIEKYLFTHCWNGVMGSGCKTHWGIASSYRRTVQHMRNGDIKPDFRTAIDAAIAAQEKSK